jgi:hypothetical protein
MPPHTTPAELIKKVESCVHSTTPSPFSTEDWEDVRKMLVAWRTWAAMGRGFKWIVTSLGLLGGLLGSLAVIGAAALYVWGVVTGKRP